MKNKYLTLIIMFFIISAYSQDKFEIGYFIDNNNLKTECLIKNMDWKSNPYYFKYKLSATSDVQKATIKTVKEFEIIDQLKYVRATVNIDNSNSHLSDLSYDMNPVFKKETFFLKALVIGKASLYVYEQKSFIRFFFKTNTSDLQQLIFKKYKSNTLPEIVKTNTTFRKQIYDNLKSNSITLKKALKIEYTSKSLIKTFVNYNEEYNQVFSVYKKKHKHDLFNMSLKVGLNYSSLNIKNPYEPEFKNKVSLGNQIKTRFGVETEFVLPYNNNKWAVVFDPAFQSFKSTTSHVYEFLFSTMDKSYVIETNFQAIELPVGIRYYYFLNPKSKLFLNGYFVYDYIFNNSKINITEEYSGRVLNMKSKYYYFSAGIGYKYNNRFSLEARFYTPKNTLNTYRSWETEYNNISIILGYQIF